MATEVSDGMVKRKGGKSAEILITRDLLGGLTNNQHNHFNPDNLQIPLHFKATDKKEKMIIEEEMMEGRPLQLELKLVTSSSSSCQSVCTLDKVKSALENQNINNRNNNNNNNNNSIASMSMKKKKMKRHDHERNINMETSSSSEEEEVNCGMFAAACPACFMYVITFTHNPICPRCNSTVLPSFKKFRFDLNASHF